MPRSIAPRQAFAYRPLQTRRSGLSAPSKTCRCRARDGETLKCGVAPAKAEHGTIGGELEVEILGERFPAKVMEESPWDPQNERSRA